MIIAKIAICGISAVGLIALMTIAIHHAVNGEGHAAVRLIGWLCLGTIVLALIVALGYPLAEALS